MFNNLDSLLGKAVIDRLTLLANHVIAAEPAAVERLLPHAGRCMRLQFDGWPTVLPPLPATAFRITPAGLVEACDEAAADVPDLRVVIDASNPARAFAEALGGTRPRVEIAGDAAFATDLHWLFDHLRWDVQDDLSRIVGTVPARELSRIAGGIANGMRKAAATLGGWVARR